MRVRGSRTHRPVVALAAAAIGFAVAPAMAGRSSDEGTRPERPVVLDGQGRASDQGRGPTRGGMNAEQTDTSVRMLAIGPAGWLELRNLAGDITVTAAPGREARVEIVRRSRGRTEADAKLGLERTRVVVDHKGDQAMVTVERDADRRAPYFVRVTYTVSVPPGTRIAASTLSGNVTISDVKGDITAHVTQGDVDIRRASQVSNVQTLSGDVTLVDLQSDRGVTVNALSGDVQLERVRARRVEVDVTSGDVELRAIVSDTVQVKSLSGSIEFEGGLASGGRYDFQTYSGTVSVLLTGSTGVALQASTFRGNLRLDPSLDLKTPLATRGSVRGTVGDGAATLIATTFSGDVVLSRK